MLSASINKLIPLQQQKNYFQNLNTWNETLLRAPCIPKKGGLLQFCYLWSCFLLLSMNHVGLFWFFNFVICELGLSWYLLISFLTCEPGWPFLACWISFQYFHLLTGFILLSFVFCEPGWSFLASWISHQFCYLWTRLVLLRPRPRGVRWEWDTWWD